MSVGERSAKGDKQRRGLREELPWHLMGRRQISLTHYDTSDDDKSSISDTPPVRVPRWNAKIRPGVPEPEGEFWQITKLIKYLVVGDQCATNLALSCLGEFDYTIKPTQKLLVQNNALEVLVNILETDDLQCKIGVMKIMVQLSKDYHMRNFLIDLGVVPLLICHSNHPCKELQNLTITTLASFAKVRKVRTIVRKCGGVKYLLDVVDEVQHRKVNPEDDSHLVVVHGLNALWELSKSPKIREILHNAGLLQTIPKLINAKDHNITLPALGILMLCSSLANFREGMEGAGLIIYIIKNLSSPSVVRKTLACRTVFKCLVSEESRSQFFKKGGLDPLMEIMKDDSQCKEYKLIKYCTASIWRSCDHEDSLNYIDGKSLLSTLMKLIQHEKVLVGANAANILGQLTRIPRNREMLRRLGGMKLLVDLIESGTNDEVLASLAKVAENCSKWKDCAEELTSLNALRNLWRLLNSSHPRTKANAAWATVDLVNALEDAGEEVRSYVGGIAKLVETLDHKDQEVNAAGLAAIAAVAKDSENLEILNDYGVLKKICHLSNTENDVLREQIAVCVTTFANDKRNSFKFGEFGVTQNLVNYISSDRTEVKTAAAFAMWKLSEEPVNCIILHRNGVVPLMLECAAYPCPELQEAAAGVMTNIRGLAHDADQIHVMGDVVVRGPKMHRSFTSKTKLMKDSKVL